MDNELDSLPVTFLDALTLFHTQGDGEVQTLPDGQEGICWRLEPKYLLSSRGIYIDVAILEARLSGKEFVELGELLITPSGDMHQPCLTFPCTFGELKEFIKQGADGELIDPFIIAEWVGKKFEEYQVNHNVSSSHQQEKDVNPRRRTSYLTLIEGLMLKHMGGEIPEGHYKAASVLQCELESHGLSLNQDTVASIVKEVQAQREGRR